MTKKCLTCRQPKTANRTKDSEFTYRKDSDTYMRDCKECRNRKARDKRKNYKPLGTQRIKIPSGNGKAQGTIACDRCSPGTRMMCEDRCNAGRAVLCEVMTEEERQFEYAITQ